MQEASQLQSEDERARLRRSDRRLFVATIVLAAIGAPLLMQGAVLFARSLSAIADGSPLTTLGGLAVFALSTVPLAVAGYTWKRTDGFRQFSGED